MRTVDTIAAIATPAGTGSIGIVRISGPQAFTIARAIFRGPELEPFRLAHGHLVSPEGELVDEVVLLPYAAPRSYTGEDVIEICCHGGMTAPAAVLGLCLRSGARHAAPGEFTQRAFLNGKMDLAQAEAVCDLILASAEAQRRLATRQLAGELSNKVRALRERLLGVLGAAEAAVDFAEEVGELNVNEAVEALESVELEIRTLRKGFRDGKLIREGAVVAIIGLPNVGKSSLLNALLGTERAIVTPIPGTTRDTVEDRISLDGVPVVLWDTAGLRDTTDPVERIGVHRTEEAMRRADLLLLVLAPENWEDPLNRELVGSQAPERVIAVLNKADLGTPPLETEYPGVLRVSALTGEGLEELRMALRSRILSGEPLESVLVSRVRHDEALADAERAVGEALRTLQEPLPIDMVCIHLRDALDALGLITGEAVTADIVERIFADFCIGK